MRPRQPQLAKPHCLFEGDRAILIEKVIDIAKKMNVASGIHMGNIEALKKWRAKGMQMIMYNSDLGFLIEGATENLETLKKDK